MQVNAHVIEQRSDQADRTQRTKQGEQDAQRGDGQAVRFRLVQVALGCHVVQNHVAALGGAFRVGVRVERFHGLQDAHQ